MNRTASSRPTPPEALHAFGLTDRGRRRDRNEDQFLISQLCKSMFVSQSSLAIEDRTRILGGSQGHLWVVADGMGGHVGGQEASSLAVETMSHFILNTMPWFFRLDEDHEDDLLDELRAGLRRCNRTVRSAGQEGGSAGMGTTLTLAYVLVPRLFVVHAGDSRCYLQRGDRLEQITNDHTVAPASADEGAREDPARSRLSHVLWNAVGGSVDEIWADVHAATLEAGDTLLLCTDGLTAHVDDLRIAEILRKAPTAEEACTRLVSAANDGGGSDNITAIVGRLGSAEEQVAPIDPDALRAHAPALGAPGARGRRTVPSAATSPESPPRSA